MYAEGDYDLAGFAVGAVERDGILTGENVRPGDRVLGLASSGVHSNGFSLVRRVVAQSGLAYDERAPFEPNRSLGEALLEPTRIYVRAGLAACRSGKVKAFAHITGGGLIENPPRVVPDSCAFRLDATAWRLPAVFRWLMETAGIEPMELARTFNCGIGMIAVTAPGDVQATAALLAEHGIEAVEIGDIVARNGSEPAVDLRGIEAWQT
jgi:phosphoribosylformylglycinamidine cyclo-ligase